MGDVSGLTAMLLAPKGIVFWIVTAVAGLAAATIYLGNQRNRNAIDRALMSAATNQKQIGMWEICQSNEPEGPKDRALAPPERLWCYGRAYLQRFIKGASVQTTSGKTALQLYARPTLIWYDAAFAIALAVFTALVALGIAPLLPWQPCASYFMLLLACMGLVYGAADLAEDLKLVAIFEQGGRVDPDDAAAANALTRLKLVSITLSVIGALTFALLGMIGGLLQRFSR